MKRVHLEIFKFFKDAFLGQLYDKAHRVPFIKVSMDEEEHGKYLSKDEFEALSLEEQFQSAFHILNDKNWKEFLAKNDLDFT